MKRYYTSFCLLVAVFGVALLANVPAQAQTIFVPDYTSSDDTSSPPLGLAYGQTLRLNIFIPSEKGATSLKTVAVAVRATLYDARGNLIAQSAEATIPAGQFHSFDFNRNALPLAGEPGTGRLQMRAVLEMRFDRLNLVQFTVEMSGEVINNSTGETTAPLGRRLRFASSVVSIPPGQ